MRPTFRLSIVRPFITPTHDSKIPFYDAQLAAHLNEHPQELRRRVLSLYRSIVRTVMHTPQSKARDDAFVYARNEFRRNLEEKDLLKAYYLAQQGETEWKMLRRYFDDMRIFDRRNIREGELRPRKKAPRSVKEEMDRVKKHGPAALPGWRVKYTTSKEKRIWNADKR